MEILAAYDLTRSYRDAAKICGVSHKHGALLCESPPGRCAGAGGPAARSDDRHPFLPQMISWVGAVPREDPRRCRA